MRGPHPGRKGVSISCMRTKLVGIINVFLFAFHYLVLVATISMGIHQTLHPIGIRWRWRNWNFPGKRKQSNLNPVEGSEV